MIDREIAHAQEATIYPTLPETAMMIIIAMMLLINLGATIRAANYEPECVPAIQTERTV